MVSALTNFVVRARPRRVIVSRPRSALRLSHLRAGVRAGNQLGSDLNSESVRELAFKHSLELGTDSRAFFSFSALSFASYSRAAGSSRRAIILLRSHKIASL